MNANHNLHDFLKAHCEDIVDTHESAIGILFDYYSESQGADSPEIHALLQKLRLQLGSENTEAIMSTVFELCTLHEECGFRGGFSMGITLAKELTSME